MHVDRPFLGIQFYGEWKSSKTLRTLHRHRNDGLEIVLISKGEVKWAIEDRSMQVRANSFFYTLPWQEHGGTEEVQSNCEITYLCLRLEETYQRPRRRFRFHPALGFSPGDAARLSAAFTSHPTQVVAGDEAPTWLLDHLIHLLRSPVPLKKMLVRDTIRLLVGALAGLAATRQTAEARLLEAERRVREFTARLAVRHAEPWTLAGMSAACRLGRTQFAGLVKKQTGDTPMTYLNRVRVQRAQRLLVESDKAIIDIALEVGFNSSQYFATVFKQFAATDARHYRAKAHGTRIVRD